MNERDREIIKQKIVYMVNETKKLLKNLYPDKRFNNDEEELVNRIVEIIEIAENSSHDILLKDLMEKIFEKFGSDYSLENLNKMIDEMSLLNSLDYNMYSAFNESLIMINNLVELAFANKKEKDLRSLFFDSSRKKNFALIQFLASKENEKIGKFLWKKPFKYSGPNIQELIKIYERLSGYFEIYTKLILLSKDLLYRNEDMSQEKIGTEFKKHFSKTLYAAQKYYDLSKILINYNKNLRNCFVHPDSITDYNELAIKYDNQTVDFGDFLIDCRKIYQIVNSIAYLNVFIMRKEMENQYLFFKEFENMTIQEINLRRNLEENRKSD